MNNHISKEVILESTGNSLLVDKEFIGKYKKLDKGIRSYLRPMLFGEVEKKYKTVNKLRKLKKPDEISDIEEVILLSKKEHILPDLFPKEPKILHDEFFLESISVDKHLSILNLTVKKNLEKLTDLLMLISELNNCILKKEYIESENIIKGIIDNYGYSHFLLRKMVLLNELSKITNIDLLFIDSEIEFYNNSGKNQILSSLQQCYDVELSYFNLKKSVMNISDFECYLNTIIRIPFLYKKYSNDKSNEDIFLKYNLQSSLIDGLIFLKCNKNIYEYDKFYYLSKIIGLLSDNSIDIDDLARFYLSIYGDDGDDIEDIFSKQSSAWYEINGVGSYRVLQDLFVDNPNSNYLDLNSNINKLSNYLTEIISDYDLLSLLNPSIVEKDSDSGLKYLINKGAVTRSAIFNYRIALTDGEVDFKQDTLYWIMGNTRELPRSINYQSLRKMATRSDDLESKVIYYLLIHKQSRSELDNHRLRKFLEKVVIEEFNGDLINFIDHQSKKSNAVAYFTYEICTVDFIAKLTHIIKDTVLITETRAKLHRWMWKNTDDKAYFERARTLLIDHQINKIRNELHDNRIYVDAQRFNDWISEEMIREFTSVLSNIEKTGLTEYYDSPQLYFLVEKVYKEFCSNNIYGISSYLGRRIRHGTFRGTMFNNITSSMEKSYSFNNQGFNVIWEKWKNEYDVLINTITTTYLHVESDTNPKGIIKPDINNHEKQIIAKACIQSLMNAFFVNGSNVQLNNLLIEYCWRLIEVDLKSVNQFLNTTQTEVLNFTVAPKSAYNQKYLDSFFKELRIKVRESFTTVFEWFKRPQSVAPRADVVLLIKAVIEEVKESFGNLKYNDQQLVSKFVLFGGAYHVIYDALYVIIFNAAKHGDSSKELNISIDFNSEVKRLFISISSDIYDYQDESYINKVLKISNDADINNAQLYEGRSGILKLHHLEKTDTNFSIEKIVCKEAKVEVVISYKVM